MKAVYQGAHGVDAHMIKGVLEGAGIPAQVRGEYLQGALGEIPAGGMVAVWVAEADAARARALVLDWERSVPDVDDDPQTGDAAEPPPSRRPGRGGFIRAAIAAALLVPVLWWALMRLLG